MLHRAGHGLQEGRPTKGHGDILRRPLQLEWPGAIRRLRVRLRSTMAGRASGRSGARGGLPPRRLRPLRARLVGCLLWSLAGWVSPAHAAVVAPSPGREVVILREEALVVYDPLAATQTVVVQHAFEGTSAPFGLLIPTPRPTRSSIAAGRLQHAIRSRLHPVSRARRTLDVDVVSWIGGCAVREVGVRDGSQPERGKSPTARGTIRTLSSAAEPLHDWITTHGFTLAPAQALWLRQIQSRGWFIVAVVVEPPRSDGPPPTMIRGPVLALTHEADEPIYAAGHPPFALELGDGPSTASPPRLPPLEIAVLTEWAVSIANDEERPPFYANTLTGRDVTRLGSQAGGLPWGFRRAGTLTAFELERAQVGQVLRFQRSPPRSPVRPKPERAVRAHNVRLPVELVALFIGLLVWAWRRRSRRRPRLKM